MLRKHRQGDTEEQSTLCFPHWAQGPTSSFGLRCLLLWTKLLLLEETPWQQTSPLVLGDSVHLHAARKIHDDIHYIFFFFLLFLRTLKRKILYLGQSPDLSIDNMCQDMNTFPSSSPLYTTLCWYTLTLVVVTYKKLQGCVNTFVNHITKMTEQYNTLTTVKIFSCQGQKPS